ncbi:hypothetical protein BU16DRAFT_520938 [Lophium mytilinum]|uniref:Uncharacterized protein n=1 Tax=Lophium mytilinum TaxID=390894 RepID=A0A6A6RBH2_9PEZI|nr:hypothetical protein BU16DRAFT_520938 [Lophium mytilinum]
MAPIATAFNFSLTRHTHLVSQLSVLHVVSTIGTFSWFVSRLSGKQCMYQLDILSSRLLGQVPPVFSILELLRLCLLLGRVCSHSSQIS